MQYKTKEPIPGLRQHLAIEIPLKMIENANFILKAFFVLEIFYPDFLVYVEKRFDKNA